MKKHLGDILLEKGYISSQDLNKALAYQMRKVLGNDMTETWATDFLLDIARTKYNNRSQFYLGKILTEMKLLPENHVLEALEIQKTSVDSPPRTRLDALNRIIVRMNSSYNLIELLNQILVLAAQLVEAESASLSIYDHTRDTLVILMPTGPGAEAVRDLEVPKDRGIVGWVYRNARPVICNDTTRDGRFYAAIDAASGYTSRQILCVPLTVKDKRLGAIEAINRVRPSEKGERGFSSADQYLLEMFSAQAAIAIENTRLAIALSQAEEDIANRAGDISAAQKAHAGALVAGSLLHEMRKSLVPLQGYAARLGEISRDQRVEKYRTYIDVEMERLMTRAQDVARFLNDGYAPAPRNAKVSDLLKELESRLWVECRTSGIAFSTELKDDLTIQVDTELLLTALEHLFRNARDAMPEGGTFTVTARHERATSVVIEAMDTGRGIHADPIERVFEPFYSSGVPNGAGLGLSIARKIVELHKGSITAANRTDGSGALITITLPAD
jgi:signal transduction histidine kinase